MERVYIKGRLRELKEMYKLSMDQYINLSIISELPPYIKFYEERAIEKIDFITDLEDEISSKDNKTSMSLESKIGNWSFTYGRNNSNYPKRDYNMKHLVDEEALYEIYDILNEDLSQRARHTLKRHLFLIESTLVAYGYLIRHIKE